MRSNNMPVAAIKTQPGEEIQQSLSATPEEYTTSNSSTNSNTLLLRLRSNLTIFNFSPQYFLNLLPHRLAFD
jgi:hypothetical protein